MSLSVVLEEALEVPFSSIFNYIDIIISHEYKEPVFFFSGLPKRSWGSAAQTFPNCGLRAQPGEWGDSQPENTEDSFVCARRGCHNPLATRSTPE